MTHYYRQCLVGSKTLRQITWLPETYAKLNSEILLNHHENKTNEKKLWKVISVGKVRFSEDEIRIRERSYKKQRGVSDI